MPYEYIRFTSKNSPNDGQSSYTINLPKTIENCVSAHVKSFSMPNTAYNITEGNNLIEWYEYDSSAPVVVGSNPLPLSATLPQIKFYSIAELLTDIGTAMTTASASSGFGMTFTLTQIASTTAVDTYHTQVNVVSLDANDTWCPLVHTQSIWEMIGFRVIFNNEPTRGRITHPIITNKITEGTDSRLLSTDLTGAGGVDHVSQFPPRDSHEAYHITSSLATSVYEAQADGTSKHTNYLLTIPNTSNRYSWLQYVPTEPVFHDLGGRSITSFTLGLADEHGFMMKNTEHQIFSVVLAIEYRDLHQTLEDNQLRTIEWRRSHC